MNQTQRRRILATLASCWIASTPLFGVPDLGFTQLRFTQLRFTQLNLLQADEVKKPLAEHRSASPISAGGVTAPAARGEVRTEAEVANLLADLDSSSYRQRREAFLKLCDRSYPIDSWLESQKQNGPKKDAALIDWLIQLRRADGNLVERLETLSALQRASRGDDTQLYQMVFNNRWHQAIEVLSLLSPAAAANILRDQGGLGRFVELAWAFDNEWAVPKLLDLATESHERIAINRWWKDLGLPDHWHLKEQDDAPSKLARLEAEGRWKEAIEFARENADSVPLERTLLRAGDWAGWLQFHEGMTANTGFSGRDVAPQQVVANLLLGREKEAQLVWQKIKERPSAMSMPGLLTLALAMDDQATVDAYLKSQDPQTVFNIHLFQFGRLREAFAAKGFLDIEDREGLKDWVSNQVRRLFAERNEMSSNRMERDPMLALFSAVHQSGIAEAQQGIDEACQDAIDRNASSSGSFRARDILGILARLNQREKAREYLERIAIDKGYPLTVFGGKELEAHHDSIEEPCFAILYSTTISEPFLIFEFLVRHYVEDRNLPNDQAVRQALHDLEDLHAGRRPTGWESPDFLRTLTLSVRQRIQELSRDDSGFCLSIAKIHIAFGEVNQAISLLQDWSFQPEALRQLASALEKSGRPELAGKLLQQRGQTADFEWFLDTARLLEQSGQENELRKIRMQQLSSVHATPYLMVSPFYSAIPEELVVQRPETKWMVDRWSRIAPERQANIEATFRYMLSKKEISESTEARRAAELDWMNRSADALRLGDSTVRFVFISALPVLALEAIHRKDEQGADKWIRMAHRIEPMQIQLIIDLLPWADQAFPKEVTDRWFQLYYETMNQAITDFPEDAVSLNNTAWLCALCDRNLDKALEFATRAVAKRDDPTYLDTLAEVEFRLGNVEKALQISQQCQAREPREDQHFQQMKRFAKILATKND